MGHGELARAVHREEAMTTPAATAPPHSEISLTSVLWATDLSPYSEKALRHATQIARYFGSKLYLMHVVSSLGYTLAGPDSMVYASAAAHRDLRGVEHSLILHGAVAGIDHEVIVSEGDVWQSIERVSAQKNIGLIVIGTHSRTGIAKLLLGSTAEEIFRKSSRPVLTVGPNCPDQNHLTDHEIPPPVLFPTDFTEESLAALPYAVQLANEQNTRLILHHAIDAFPDRLRLSQYSANDVVRLRSSEKQRAFDRLHSCIRGSRTKLTPLCNVQFGEAADSILSTASRFRVGIIVLGLKANPFVEVASHFRWSAASSVVSDSFCPVLTVRA